jgi:hypothetical protein
MRPNDGDCILLVSPLDTDDLVLISPDSIEECESNLAAGPGTMKQKGVGLKHDRVCC